MIRNGVRIPSKNGPPSPFRQGISMEDAPPDRLRFVDCELARFLASGAWEEGHYSRNGRSIYKPVETAYMHVDMSGYGWGAVINETTEARGFQYYRDRELHNTYKELKTVRYSVLTFLSELRDRHVLLRDDNMGVVHILANLSFRSPLLMTELRKLWFILDSNDISIHARRINTTANIWAERLSREIDYDD
eukprot:jgi/Tetstr1/436776/TSEL_025556.t1